MCAMGMAGLWRRAMRRARPATASSRSRGATTVRPNGDSAKANGSHAHENVRALTSWLELVAELTA